MKSTPAGAKLGGKHETGRLEARLGVLVRRDLGHGGHIGEFGAEALHAAALMVDADEDARDARRGFRRTAP